MSRQKIIEIAIRASIDRGYIMYIIYDEADGTYGFTQERNIFLTNGQSIVSEVDGYEVFNY